MKLDGFGIFVKDMPTMVRFYRDVLGFGIREDENASNVYLEKDGTLFLLFRRRDFEKMTNRTFGYAPGMNGHYEIALSVSDYRRSMRPSVRSSRRAPNPSWSPPPSRGDSVPAMWPTRRATLSRSGRSTHDSAPGMQYFRFPAFYLQRTTLKNGKL